MKNPYTLKSYIKDNKAFVIDWLRKRGKDDGLKPLADRDLEVLFLKLLKKSHCEVADRLGISRSLAAQISCSAFDRVRDSLDAEHVLKYFALLLELPVPSDKGSWS